MIQTIVIKSTSLAVFVFILILVSFIKQDKYYSHLFCQCAEYSSCTMNRTIFLDTFTRMKETLTILLKALMNTKISKYYVEKFLLLYQGLDVLFVSHHEKLIDSKYGL